MNDKLQELVNEGVIGAESYHEKREGGQQAGPTIFGYRIWMPKDSDFPDVDIRIKRHRSQHKNRIECISLFELITGI